MCIYRHKQAHRLNDFFLSSNNNYGTNYCNRLGNFTGYACKFFNFIFITWKSSHLRNVIEKTSCDMLDYACLV